MRVLTPFANQLGARLQQNGSRLGQLVALVRAFGKSTQSALGREAQAAVSAFLNPVGDATDQQIAAQPGRRRRSIQLAPFDPKVGGGQYFEGNDPGFDIDFLRLIAGCEILAAGRPASFLASLLGLANWRHAPASAM